MNKKMEVKAHSEKNPQMENVQAREDLVNQLLYLQKTIGNKEVGDLISKNIIHSATSPNVQNSLVRNERKKNDFEQDLILEDMKEIEDEVKHKIELGKLDDVRTLMERKPGKPVFANIKSEMVYVSIPGSDDSMFYHETRLVDFSLSNQEVEKKDESREIKRGMIVPVTFSLRVELPETVITRSESEEMAAEHGDEFTPEEAGTPPLKELLPTDTIRPENPSGL
jgi:hypothetical protein